MATDVGRSLTELDSKINKLKTDINSLKNINKEFDKTLKYDPKNAEALSKRMQNTKKEIELTTQKLQLLIEKQKEASKQLEAGTITQSAFDKISLDVQKANNELLVLNKSLDSMSKKDFSKLISSFNTISKFAKTILISAAGFVTTFALTGDKIQKAVERYKVSAESFQYSSLYFERATGNADDYTKALTAVTSQLGALEKGSAKAVKAFALVGLTAEDLKGKTADETLNLIIEKLRLIDDEAQRTAIATALLSNSGQDVALVAGLTADAIDEMNKELEASGIITGEQAEQAALLNDKLDTVKYSFKSMAAEVGVSLMPVLESFVAFINAALPIISAFANVFANMPNFLKTASAGLLIILAILPKLISGFKAVSSIIKVFTKSTLSPLYLKIMLIVAAVVATIAIIYKVINALNKLRGKKTDYSLAKDLSAVTGFSDLATVGTTATAGTTNNYITNNYDYDYSTDTYNISKEVDADEVIEKINVAIKVRR